MVIYPRTQNGDFLMRNILLGCLFIGLTLVSSLESSAKYFCCPIKDKCAPVDKCAPKAKCTPKCDKCSTCPAGTKAVNRFYLPG